MKPLAARAKRLTASETVRIAALVAELKAKGEKVIGFSVGEPDFDTPLHIREAAAKAMREGKTHYVPAAGIPELREAVAEKTRRENRIPCAAKNVLVTPTKQAIMEAVMAVVDHGDEVLVPDPAWVSYVPLVEWAGGKAVRVPLDPARGWSIDPQRVAKAVSRKTKMVILNSPSNPTGGVDRPDDVKAVADLAKDHDLWVLSDEMYEYITYEGAKVLSPGSLPGMAERTITVNGLSKSYAMTGWRMGWAVAPEPVFSEMLKVQSHSITCATSFAQYAAVAALTGPRDFIATMVEEFTARRRIVLDGLAKIDGFTVPKPLGAFYAFPDFGAGRGTSAEFCERLLREAKVAVTPGGAFGPSGDRSFRLSFACSRADLQEGLRRIGEAVSRMAPQRMTKRGRSQ